MAPVSLRSTLFTSLGVSVCLCFRIIKTEVSVRVASSLTMLLLLRATVNALPGPNPGTLAAPSRIPRNSQGRPLSSTALSWEGLGVHVRGCELELKPLTP